MGIVTPKSVCSVCGDQHEARDLAPYFPTHTSEQHLACRKPICRALARTHMQQGHAEKQLLRPAVIFTADDAARSVSS